MVGNTYLYNLFIFCAKIKIRFKKWIPFSLVINGITWDCNARHSKAYIPEIIFIEKKKDKGVVMETRNASSKYDFVKVFDQFLCLLLILQNYLILKFLFLY